MYTDTGELSSISDNEKVYIKLFTNPLVKY